ncbi:MAG: endolytic transglycosylase MltG [Chloroflexi bacterium HGW-Chloroflexi-3]|nr:MAG: endolytic transglycosylase MltG [Chloroflexi bacterium HGW-Chloroflexi-3]
MSKQKKNRLQSCLLILFIISIVGLLGGVVWLYTVVSQDVKFVYGEPDPSLSFYKNFVYTTRLYFSEENLLVDQNNQNEDYYFEILPGETVGQIAYRLKMNGLIENSETFNTFLIYKGYDRKVQSGYFLVKPEMNGIEIAEKIINPIPDKVRFIILPGWRMEEIGGILPNSGLEINTEEFFQLVRNPSSEWLPTDLQGVSSLEGYLFPGEYLVDRKITTIDFIQLFLNAFLEIMSDEYLNAISEKGLTLNQAIIIASMVEREAVIPEEMPMIASVFLNRYLIGMKFDSDPTVQYAVGYNINQATWWTNPLSLNDLRFDSPFNTYLYNGLTPHAICNPSLNAIKAVAFASETPYYYFRAKCDGSGYHNFAETYEEHLENGCP